MLQALLVSTGAVALAEVGDKTQLLSLVLAARYRRPLPIVAGVLVATLASHAGAGALGVWLAQLLAPRVLAWLVVGSFLLMAAWILVPDRLDDDDDAVAAVATYGSVFMATVVAFFLAEMGDKTQIATVMLAARFRDFLPVVAGTTLGMLAANVPVIWLGHRYADRLSPRTVHRVACVLFVVLGLLALRNALEA
ncbi:MAG: TMEM165/GDT1 family protein [Pseudomonadota bacterium]|nr:TMEM165/GDT1 family protein [Pseudomonadota bacterium]